MRVLFLILFLLGAAAGFGTPFLPETFRSAPLGEWRVYQPAAGFHSVDVPLTPSAAPLRMLLDLSAPGPFVPDGALSSATLTVAQGGKTVFAKPVTFRDAALHDDNPQTPDRSFQVEAGTLAELEGATYTFTVSRGEAEIPQVTSFDLVLERAAPSWLRFLQPAGFAALAVGFIGFVLTVFRRTPATPAEARKPRWGRGASDA